MQRVEFTKEMKKTYKILAPGMAEIHFRMLHDLFARDGYDIEILNDTDQSAVTNGLKYVHNDTCYPALITIGQMISALKSGKYDIHHTALLMTQTGGGCRASNYIHLLRKALEAAGMPFVPVISLNLSGMEKNSGFKISFGMLRKGIAVLAYGDLLMLLVNQTRPYEKNAGDADALCRHWTDKLCEGFARGRFYSRREVKRALVEIRRDFEKIETVNTPKIKVGIVGEIFVKYSPLANNDLEKFLASQGCEVMVPGITAFMLYCVDTRIDDINLYGGKKLKKRIMGVLYRYLESYEKYQLDALEGSKYVSPSPFAETKAGGAPFIGSGCKMGEGWLLTAEMVELIKLGYTNIVCVQPFGCLPNHIVGKGMVRKLRETYPQSNIVPVDYDPGATRVNQENRIKLMLSVARETMEASPAKEQEAKSNREAFSGAL